MDAASTRRGAGICLTNLFVRFVLPLVSDRAVAPEIELDATRLFPMTGGRVSLNWSVTDEAGSTRWGGEGGGILVKSGRVLDREN